MRILLVFCLLIGTIDLSIAQNFKSSSAFEGYAVTHADTIKGTITVNQEDNQVLLKSGKAYNNLSVRQLKKVVINNNGKTEIFHSGPFGMRSEPYLFRALVDGPFPLLYREGLKFDKYDDDFLPPYFVKTNGQVFVLGEKKEIISLFRGHKNELQKFIKDKKNKLKSEEELIEVFAYYNLLLVKEDTVYTD